jgi:hypothetical protein
LIVQLDALNLALFPFAFHRQNLHQKRQNCFSTTNLSPGQGTPPQHAATNRAAL